MTAPMLRNDFSIADPAREPVRGIVIVPADYVRDENGCWLWQGFINGAGYGQTSRGGLTKAHHIAWAWRHGRKPPKGWHVHHTCKATSCVNPDHLELLSPRAHIQHHRLTEKDLTLDDVREIRRLGTKRGISDRKLGEQFGVSFMAIQRIWRGESWARELGVIGRVELEPGECVRCGEVFTGRRRDAVYCSKECQMDRKDVAA